MTEPHSDMLERPGDEAIVAHLRHALRAIAETVEPDDPSADVARPATDDRFAARRRRRRRLAAGATVAALASASVAWNRFDQGEIERIPVEEAILHGDAPDGGQWWLIPSPDVHTAHSVPSTCVAMVDFVSAAANWPGVEWNTGGVTYGEPTGGSRPGCNDETAWLADPTRFSMGSSRLGDNDNPATAWGHYAAVHPTITTIEVAADTSPPFVAETQALPDRPDGPRFTAFTVPAATTEVRVTLRSADGTTVTERVHQLPG